MAEKKETVTETTDRELVITRLFNAPRELVFEVWTQPAHTAQWWGSTGFTNTIHEMEVKPGGVWRFIMHGPDGVDYPNKIVYTRVVKPELLAFFYDADLDNDPGQFEVTVTFTQKDKKTEITMRMLFPTKEELNKVVKEYGAIERNQQTMDRLEKYLSEVSVSGHTIVSTRMLNANRALVFKAWTDPAHLSQWWGPKGFTNTFHEFDLKPGGVWEFIMHGPNGVDYPNKSIFVEIVNEERIVFDHLSIHKFRAVATFEDQGHNRTKVTYSMIHQSPEESGKVRHYVVPANEENFDRLEMQLVKMACSQKRLTITRVFNAPPELVFDAWTDPKQVAVWWGPKDFTNPVCQLDVRPGGAIYIHMKGPDGTVYPMSGTYREIVKPERLVFVSAALDPWGNKLFEIINTITFVGHNGKTTLTVNASVDNITPEAAPYIAGMDQGWNQSLERLQVFISKTSI